MSHTENKVLIENISTLNYWLYLEYAKQALRTQASKKPGTRVKVVILSSLFFLAAVASVITLFNSEGFQYAVSLKGSVYTIAYVVATPLALFLSLFMIFQAFFPYIYLASRFRLKHSANFFTDSSDDLLKEIVVNVSCFEDKIIVERGGIVSEEYWESVIEITESKHFYFLILEGEIIDKHNAYIRSGIIINKDGFTKGSFEELKGCLREYGSESIKKQLSEAIVTGSN